MAARSGGASGDPRRRGLGGVTGPARGRSPGLRARRRCPGAVRGRRQCGKRWPARNFRVRDCSCTPGEWRHCNTSGREGRGTGGERYAPATFLSRRTDSPRCPPAPAARRKRRMRQAGQTGRWSRAQRRPRPARTRDEAVHPDNRRQRSTGLSDADSFSRGIATKMPNLAPPGHRRKP